MVYGLYVVSPVIGFLATVAGGNDFRQLDASTEASGPHDFAVRDPSCAKRFAGPGTGPTNSGEGGKKRRSSCVPEIPHGEQSALRSRRTPDAAASTASRPTFATIIIRPSFGTGRREL